MPSTTKKDLDKWIVYPDVLTERFDNPVLINARKTEGATFDGYLTRDDITEIRGGFPVGQNMIFTDGGKPTMRPGFEPIGTEVMGISTPVTRAWRFERRDGVEIEMKSYDTGMYFRVDGVMEDFSLLKGGFTANKKFTFDVLSQTTDVNSEVLFCNGVEAWQQWTGVYGLFASLDNTAHTLTLQGSINLSDMVFTATGSFSINGVSIAYTGLSGQTFTGCADMTAILATVVGSAVTQSPIAISTANMLPSSVSIASDGRIHTRNEAKASVHLFSQLDNPILFTATGVDGGGGAKEIEQGGPITAFAKDEQQIYVFKKRLIKTLKFVAGGTRVDIPQWSTYKTGDDKSTTIGAIGDKSTFSAPNGIIFVTEDKEMLFMKRQEFIDYPQSVSISDPIKPTFFQGVHDDASGIVFKSKIYYAYKQDSSSTFNDTVIVYDLIRNRWFMPFVGWNVADWTIINNELHWHSSTSPNSYRVIDDKTDNGLPFTTVLRTHSEDFGFPQYQKNVPEIMLELYMTDSTQIQFDILYDEDGYTEVVTTTLDGTKDTNNIIDSTHYNTLGANAFGTERFGSNDNINGMKKYRYIIPLKANNEFYNIALQFSTNNGSSNYELIRYGFHIDGIFLKHQKHFIFKI